MSRLHYYAAMVLLVASLFSLLGPGLAGSIPEREGTWLPPSPGANRSPGGALGWFLAIKPFCNTVEVEVALRNSPAPEGMEGKGYAAACWALAGRVAEARDQLRAVPDPDRWRAAGIVFDVAHPIADAGDDRSAGPIMGLVVEFWPNHYMALYHAGMAVYGTGNRFLARKYLEQFLTMYTQDDGWRRNAIEVLGRLQ